MSGAPLENITFVNGKWTFRMKGTPGSPTFVGTISTDGKTFAGNFTQGPNMMPFRLLRAGDATVETPQSSPSLSDNMLGTWEGTLGIGGRGLHLILQMANDAAGAKAILISVDQGGGEIPVTAVTQAGTKIDLQITAIGAVYKGEVNPQGTMLSGIWSQAGQPMPLNFRKSAKR